MMGFCNGMMIEGGCRWGYDPIWIKNEPRKDENQQKVEENADPEKNAGQIREDENNTPPKVHEQNPE